MLINGKKAEFIPGETILQTAARMGVAIPVLCHHPEVHPAGGCGVCTVLDETSGRYLFSCAAKSEDTQKIITDSERLRGIRREGIELLLSDHPADCVAPCQRVCPANLPIPEIMRSVKRGIHPAIHQSCGTCAAPCEKACRRKTHGGAIPIQRILGGLPPAERPQVDKPVHRFGSNMPLAAVKELAALGEGCMFCGCAKPEDCRLREAAELTGAVQKFTGGFRALSRSETACGVVYESARCVLCGICVRYCEEKGVSIAPALHGRGFDLRIAPPIGRNWDEIPQEVLIACAQRCPTGALFRV